MLGTYTGETCCKIYDVCSGSTIHKHLLFRAQSECSAVCRVHKSAEILYMISYSPKNSAFEAETEREGGECSSNCSLEMQFLKCYLCVIIYHKKPCSFRIYHSFPFSSSLSLSPARDETPFSFCGVYSLKKRIKRMRTAKSDRGSFDVPSARQEENDFTVTRFANKTIINDATNPDRGGASSAMVAAVECKAISRRFKESPAPEKRASKIFPHLASRHLKKRPFQSPLTRVSVPPKATYTTGNHRGRSDYELTALSTGEALREKAELKFLSDHSSESRGRVVGVAKRALGIARIKVSPPLPVDGMRCGLFAWCANGGDVYTYIYISAGADGHSGCWRTKKELHERRRKLRKKLAQIKGAVELRASCASGQFLARTIILSRPIIYQPIMAPDLSNSGQSGQWWALSKVPEWLSVRRMRARIVPLYFIEKLSRNFSSFFFLFQTSRIPIISHA